ncbi:MAG: hypothetical protein PHI85_03215 [Victivallaceae bacterium]|nr:hypothetical protein [Victivallaceae bacterium]
MEMGKMLKSLIVGAVAAVAAGCNAPYGAGVLTAEWTPFQIGARPFFALFNTERCTADKDHEIDFTEFPSVYGAEFNFYCGGIDNLVGIGAGLASMTANNYGIQVSALAGTRYNNYFMNMIGVWNFSAGNNYGFEFATFNLPLEYDRMNRNYGVELGAANIQENHGVQIGLVNVSGGKTAEDVSGLQLGVFNVNDTDADGRCCQIGLLNINKGWYVPLILYR